ncbi:hypothetical protein [uncultured Fluviicola sp.]|uniref:hypothetical protein n=1 Tax=uncultured Fluviicola sp. TaxID=463303 RepID=UPI0025E791E6|nr:hypothetical protein [uncultured Fluviicola sp.]
MKSVIYSSLVLLLTLGLFAGCQKETRQTTKSSKCVPPDTIDGKWHLIRITGGITGANETHAVNEITWSFNASNSTLTVNNTVGSSTYYYLPSGTYPFQQISGPNGNYLVIDGAELGQFTFSGNQMLLDENQKSTGEGACGFYVTLQR